MLNITLQAVFYEAVFISVGGNAVDEVKLALMINMIENQA